MSIEISAEELDDLQTALADAGEEVNLRQDYSGRGMNGSNCIGIIVDSYYGEYEIGRMVGRIAATNPDLVWIEEAEPRFDSMGKDRIVYWPSISVESAEEDDG